MKINQLLNIINTHVPLNTAESWDNVGLLIGDNDSEITGILTGLDCTEEVVDEAISKKCNTIICHHPLIFKGVKQIVEQDGYGAIIRKLIEHQINLIALHTNLDVYPSGVNAMLANHLKLQQQRILNPETIHYYKVHVFIPQTHLETFKNNLSQHGLAQEGEYEYCFFESSGTGQFKPVGNAQPYLGDVGKIEHVEEYKVEFMINKHQRQTAQQLVEKYHPYETPVYDFIKMEKTADYGLGMIGELEESMSVQEFVDHAKDALKMPSVRFVGDNKQQIKKVAIIGGSGIGFEYQAAQQGADIFVTGDIKHHDALNAKIAGVNLLDINHYSEYVMKQGLKDLLYLWLDGEDSSLNIIESELNTDPFEYM